jgi:putative transposase
LKVKGLEQLHRTDDIACAGLIHKADGFYLHVTVYRQPKNKPQRPNNIVGIDFGVRTSFTFSTVDQLDYQFQETERLKYLQGVLSRQVKGSKNYNKTRDAIRREYLKIDNQKINATNELVNELSSNFRGIFFQNENLSSIKRRNGYIRSGKKMQASILGRVKTKLQNLDNQVMLSRYEPTTQFCPCCGGKTPHPPNKRTYVCQYCRYTQDRELHSSLNMIIMGMSCDTEHIASKNEIVRLFQEVLEKLCFEKKLTNENVHSILVQVAKRIGVPLVKQEGDSSLVGH